MTGAHYALTRAEAADWLRISIRQLDRHITAGTIPSAMVGGRRLIPYAALVRLVDGNTTRRAS